MRNWKSDVKPASCVKGWRLLSQSLRSCKECNVLLHATLLQPGTTTNHHRDALCKEKVSGISRGTPHSFNASCIVNALQVDGSSLAIHNTNPSKPMLIEQQRSYTHVPVAPNCCAQTTFVMPRVHTPAQQIYHQWECHSLQQTKLCSPPKPRAPPLSTLQPGMIPASLLQNGFTGVTCSQSANQLTRSIACHACLIVHAVLHNPADMPCTSCTCCSRLQSNCLQSKNSLQVCLYKHACSLWLMA
jgi:hypothetical protein